MSKIQKFKDIVNNHGLKGDEISDIIGITYGSYRNATMDSAKSCPKWIKSALEFYELGKMSTKIANIEVVNAKEIKG